MRAVTLTPGEHAGAEFAIDVSFMEHGATMTAFMEWSMDGGKTWGAPTASVPGGPLDGVAPGGYDFRSGPFDIDPTGISFSSVHRPQMDPGVPVGPALAVPALTRLRCETTGRWVYSVKGKAIADGRV